MNKIIITGRLVKDPEMRDVKIGNEIVKNCRFRIAVARRNTENETDFLMWWYGESKLRIVGNI